MSLVQLRVELPAYAHSFLLHVPNSYTILDVKNEIHKACVGSPRVGGQRLVWRGRYLVDNEKVDDLWKVRSFKLSMHCCNITTIQSPNEPRIVHLAVHPSAWESTPPDIPEVAQTHPAAPLPHPSLPSSQEVPTRNLPQLVSQPLAYVLFKHQSALRALMPEAVTQPITIGDVETSRILATQAVEGHGWTWPSILDEEFPVATVGGLKYDRVTIKFVTIWYLMRTLY